VLYELRLDCSDAWLSLCRRRNRSVLSGLGIAAGVIALVAMLSISEGAKHEAAKKIATLGINTIRVEYAGLNALRRFESAVNLSPGLTSKDAFRIKAWLGRLGEVAYFAREDDIIFSAGQRSLLGTVIGSSPSWFTVEKLVLHQGRPLIPDDLAQHRRSCVVGSKLYSALRLNLDDTIHFQDKVCIVVGVLAPKGSLLTEGTGLSAVNFDSVVIMPFTSFPFPMMIGSLHVLDGIVVALGGDAEAVILDSARKIDELLQVEHRGVLDYKLVVPVKLLRESRQTQTLFSIVMGSIAGLSLLVGGIGVMNVMLANISEQTREIGLRMAVGASRRRIIALYLWHSLLLTIASGVAGLIIGVFASVLIKSYAGWNVEFSALSLLLGPFLAVLTGLVFGLHPALRAASLNPALALRSV